VPLVCGESGGAEIVTAADAGILYDEQSPKALSAAIRNVLHLCTLFNMRAGAADYEIVCVSDSACRHNQ
jgi:hypothetical protein